MAWGAPLLPRQSSDSLDINPPSSLLTETKPAGPQFIDTGACLCALRTDVDTAAWRCIGNRTQDIYNGNSGEWYDIKSDIQPQDASTLAITDKEFPPDTSKAFVFDNNGLEQEPEDAVQKKLLTPFDEACTAKNDTLLSSHYYKALRQQAAGQTPTAAAVCLTGALPVTIQNATSWQQQGCYLGFDCSNNTINALPQYCTPVPQCYHARLGGQTCGAIPMGQFEPVVCPAGFYCPNGGKLRDCPSGFYCPKGTYKPIACSVGSVCNKNSVKDQTWLPFVFLVLIDAAMVAAILTHWILQRKANKKNKLGSTKPSAFSKAMRSMPQRQGTGGYSQLEGEDGIPLEPRIGSFIQRQPTGFLGPMDDFDMHAAAAYDSDNRPANDEGNTDLREFVASLSKCIEGSQFGLTFEFENLGFWPKKLPKPILSGITGEITRGSLVGVLGGSGAGKCESFVLDSLTYADWPSNLRQCLDGQAKWHHWLRQSERYQGKAFRVCYTIHI